MKNIATALHPPNQGPPSSDQEIKKRNQRTKPMTKIAQLAAALVLVVPVAIALLAQAAQIVA